MNAGWEHECLIRERRELTVVLALACVFFPGYAIIDLLLEPGRDFAQFRVIGTAFAIAALITVRRARTALAIRLALCVGLAVGGALVVWMMAHATHFTPYMIGYSAYFWGISILSWPLRFTVGLFALQFLSIAVVLAVAPPSLAPADYLGAAFLIVMAACISTIAIAVRRQALWRAFQTSVELAERNRDLERTMSELRDAQARLVAQEKLSALGRMLAGLSHEINNPVNIIKNNLEPVREHVDAMVGVLELARGGAAAEVRAGWEEHELDWRVTDVDDALRSMHEAVAHIQQVHGDLRAFIRGDSPDTKLVDVNQGLRATVALLTRRLPATVRVELQLDEVPMIACHAGELNQVWLNLTQNALDAIGGDGTLSVRARAVATGIEIAVSDDGPGVDPAFRHRLFEPFATTKDVGHGTGLGLATSYQIIQRHGGRLYVDDSYTAGARFVVELPRG